MPETKSLNGTVRNMWGKPLTELYLKPELGGALNTVPSLAYKATYMRFKNADELREAGAWPSEKDIVKYKNTAEKNKARSNASNAAVEAAGLVKPNFENDPLMRLEAAFDILIKAVPADKREDEATIANCKERAAAYTGVDWPDDEDDD